MMDIMNREISSMVGALVIFYDPSLSPTFTDRLSEVKYSAQKVHMPYHEIALTSETRLLAQLSQISDECKKFSHGPCIHFECHGNLQGLLVNEKILLSHVLIGKYLSRINVSCRNNLWVTFSTCYATAIVSPLLDSAFTPGYPDGAVVRSPLFMLVAPDGKVEEAEIEAAIIPMLIRLTSTDSGQFTSIDPELRTVFDLRDKRLYRNLNSPAICSSLIDSFVSDLKSNRFSGPVGFRSIFMSICDQRRILNGGIEISHSEKQRTWKFLLDRRVYDSQYVKIQEEFFMIDLFPDNASRFEVVQKIPNWEEVIRNVRGLL